MAHVLLIGDDREQVSGLRSLLRQDRHRVSCARTIEGWRDHERELQPELIVAAVDSVRPVLAGGESCRRSFPAPLLLIQPESSMYTDPFLEERLVDMISGPFLSQDLLAKVDALVRVRRLVRRDPGHEDGESTGKSASGQGPLAALSALFRGKREEPERPQAPALEVASRLAEWADRRDAFEPGHAERVTDCCAGIADALGVGDEETDALLRAAMLHDIGKVALPLDLLRQTEPLQESQVRLIRTHPRRGALLLRALFPDDAVASTVLYHHERPDGCGYYGLDGDRIPRTARILAVAEVFDAMTHGCIKQPLTSAEAMDRLRETRGQIHDADCVDALVDKAKPRTTSIALSPRGY
ncbi:MAG: HD domain-containing protein [bacterium]|nr:HD domain-containing protein [bacterium]